MNNIADIQIDKNVAKLAYLVYLKPVPDEQQGGNPISDVPSTIAQLGLDGWELVSHTVLPTPAGLESFYFKRQLS